MLALTPVHFCFPAIAPVPSLIKVPTGGEFAFKTGIRDAPVILSDLVSEISSTRAHLVALEATAVSLGGTITSTASALRAGIADVASVRAAAVDPVISALRSEMQAIRSTYVLSLSLSCDAVYSGHCTLFVSQQCCTAHVDAVIFAPPLNYCARPGAALRFLSTVVPRLSLCYVSPFRQ